MSSQSQSPSSASTSDSPPADPGAAFGANEWLVDEIYQSYLDDPESVDKAWWDFFADYKPADGSSGRPIAAKQPAPTPPEPVSGDAPTRNTIAAGAGTTTPSTPPSHPARDSKATATPAPEPVVRERSTESSPADRPSDGPSDRPSDKEDGGASAPSATQTVRLKGPAARVVTNMEASLEVPTATSVRAVPAKLLVDNRVVINNHLKRSRGGKISFTHVIGFAIVRALRSMPEMNYAFAHADGKPALVKPEHVGLGLAIDLTKPNGERTLLVPSIKNAESLDFAQFWTAYEDVVRKARGNKLGADDFVGTTITLTNPGTIGTVHSVPRLMSGQGCIIGVGAMEYPAEYQGASVETLARLGVSKVMTLTSTYDHRIIQGAQSGDFLRRVHQLLLGEDDFYDEIFRALRIPYEPIRWVVDVSASHEDDVNKTARVQELIHSYRVRGHLMADTDPLEYRQRTHPDLDIVNHGLTLWDLDREFATGGFGGEPISLLRDILGVLRNSYCRTVGIEYMHIQDPEQRAWIQERVERGHDRSERAEQLRILERLGAAEAFETFLQTKYVGQKRFSLEGGESVIPLLDELLIQAAESGLDEVAIGMPHRGRLNVLANIVGKSYGQIFREFEGNQDPKSAHGSGDVKYHLGADGEYVAGGGATVKVSLVANPSHLEAVDPVLEGFARAKQDIIGLGEGGFTVLPLLMHGDAAFAGQGVVAETLNLSQLRGYRTGGTIHVVVNNQVGFTTSPTASRSSIYATDAARMIEAPVFHVNGDDPEACVRVAKLAFAFRQAFKKDVVIDMICYRRRGHNEGDDPSMTQPMMYGLIDAKRSVRKLYTEGLIGRGDITMEEAEHALKAYRDQLEKVFTETRDASSTPHEPASVDNDPADWSDIETAITDETLKRVIDAQVSLPHGFEAHQRVMPIMQKRAAAVSEDTIDWSTGETIAFGSLLLDGVPVRLAGQDSRRGTFAQRHAVLVDRRTGAEYTPLSNLDRDQGTFYIYDSLLSEFAAMGFEYGYSVGRPDALVCWEAQFGDFAPGAQTVVDEFIASGEQKWGQRSGVVLLLPHGHEGQGPDHSSARIERFLALCAQDNMTVAMPTSSASYFHLLRWHARSPHHRPLVVFTPKSMLRLRAAASSRAEFTGGSFRPVLPDTSVKPSAVRRVVLCTGKIYWDLMAQREKAGVREVALVRVERLAPLPGREIAEILSTYPEDAELRWVQEEPANQGAWPFMALNLPEHVAGRTLFRVSRPPSSAPAVGSATVHKQEQAALVERALR